MKNNLITKIALGVALVALLFSAITLIRAFILGAGIVFAVIQLVVTIIITAICAFMLYYLSKPADGDGEEEAPAEAAQKTAEPTAVTAEAETDEIFDESGVQPAAAETEAVPDDLEEKYNWSNFEI